MSRFPQPLADSMKWFAPPQSEVHAKPDGYFDIELPDSDEPIHSDFGRLEAPCPVATMEEQRRIAADVANARYKCSPQERADAEHRALVEQIKHGEAA